MISMEDPSQSTRHLGACLLGSEAQTLDLARQFAKIVPEGTLLGLNGDLGAGKTTFVRGFVSCFPDAPSAVSSPTYLICHAYPTKPPIYHYDFYRLASEADLEELGFWQYTQGSSIVMVEWMDRIDQVKTLPHLELTFKMLDEHRRRVEVVACGLDDVWLEGLERVLT